jgi:ADP-heptose:LPS heptosyltransferase
MTDKILMMIESRCILMIKGHSMGVGDLLRSSAAWRALHDRFPGVKLHLLFLSKHAGYPSEELMRDHHLLASVRFVTIREGSPNQSQARRVPMAQIVAEVNAFAKQVKPDLVIDFESSGVRSSWIARQAAKACHSVSLGIAQFPGRSVFYDLASPSVRAYRKRHHLPEMMDYTERDFVVLAGLGIERRGTAIELNLTQSGAVVASSLRQRVPSDRLIIGLNIGCGTPDAMPRRPDLNALAEAIQALSQVQPSALVLSGAPFEHEVNEEFMALYQSRFGSNVPMLNAAGETSMSDLTGLISICDIFVSSDSGPYHLAVAMRKPTLAWFVREEPPAIHQVPWCACLINPDPKEFVLAANHLRRASASMEFPTHIE